MPCRKYWRIVWLLLLTGAVGFLNGPAFANRFANRIMNVRGQVQLQSQGSSGFRTARRGMSLNWGDRLRTGDKAWVEVQCSDMRTIWRLGAEGSVLVSSRCTDPPSSLRAVRTPGGINPDIPYVISPRNTWLVDDQFTIRWSPALDASRYTVRLYRWSDQRDMRERLLWETSASETQVEYTGAFPLEEGRYYSIEVIADTGASSNADEGAAKSGFELLFPEDREVLQADLIALNPDLSEEGFALSLAGLYLREDVLAEAIAVLEPFVEAGTDNLLIYQTLGDLYSYAGLNALSLQHYDQAQSLAIAHHDSVGEALAKLGLAEVNLTLGNRRQALRLFMQAKAVYENLGDDRQVAVIQGRINFLESVNRRGD
ncbi:MAG: tetratricopeptide repeat protein [Leptolyngbyaceae cyanobacterium MO_188.B28]|nr:tetratricopeptide repeat protein [Leptolyngbyaceae cyanobacterium MO_188.B28]